MLLPYCFDLCSFVIPFEIRKCETSNLGCFFFYIVLAIFDLLRFQMNVRMEFSSPEKNAIGMLVGIALIL